MNISNREKTKWMHYLKVCLTGVEFKTTLRRPKIVCVLPVPGVPGVPGVSHEQLAISIKTQEWAHPKSAE
jgi:hypothetical protein